MGAIVREEIERNWLPPVDIDAVIDSVARDVSQKFFDGGSFGIDERDSSTLLNIPERKAFQ